MRSQSLTDLHRVHLRLASHHYALRALLRLVQGDVSRLPTVSIATVESIRTAQEHATDVLACAEEIGRIRAAEGVDLEAELRESLEGDAK